MLAIYRLAAELTAIETTADGRCVVIGTLDGCLSVLAIADPTVGDSFQFLASLPSRRMKVSLGFKGLMTVLVTVSSSNLSLVWLHVQVYVMMVGCFVCSGRSEAGNNACGSSR